jgi:hypothetical protein
MLVRRLPDEALGMHFKRGKHRRLRLNADLIGGLRCEAARRVTCIRYPSADIRAKRFAPRTTGIRTASPIKT